MCLNVSYSSAPKLKEIHTKDHIISESAHHVVYYYDCHKKCKKWFSKKIKFLEQNPGSTRTKTESELK